MPQTTLLMVRDFIRRDSVRLLWDDFNWLSRCGEFKWSPFPELTVPVFSGAHEKQPERVAGRDTSGQDCLRSQTEAPSAAVADPSAWMPGSQTLEPKNKLHRITHKAEATCFIRLDMDRSYREFL